jgi:hypothetical protein
MDPVMSGLDPTLPLEPFGNTTEATGGDSRLYNLNVFYNVSFPATRTCSGFQSWSNAGLTNAMFPARRYRLDDHIDRPRAAHDTGSRVSNLNPTTMHTSLMELQILLLRIGKKEIGALATMAVCHGDSRRFFPMVLVGLLASFLAQGWQVHRRAG